MARKASDSDWSNQFHRSVEDKMKKAVILLVLLLGMVPTLWSSQDKPKSDESPKAEAQTTQIKAQIVFTEFENDKKVKSLPYVMYINAIDAPDLKSSGWNKLRIGSRVPVYTGGNTGNMTYLDVGTNLDVRAAHTGGDRFLLYLGVERSWVEGDVVVPVTKADTSQPEGNVGHFREPIIRQFRSELDLKVREGLVVESTMATDPLSGKVLKVEVSVSTVK
jgi:hypothetical protein